MVQITNGIVTLSVTPGAYKNIYASQGFREVNTKTPSKAKVESQIETDISVGTFPEVTPEDATASEFDASTVGTVSETPEPDVDLSEIPLGEMNSEQLKAYAKQLGVDLKGMTSKKAVRDKIRAAL